MKIRKEVKLKNCCIAIFFNALLLNTGRSDRRPYTGVNMKKKNKSMIQMMHRLVGSCGKYKASIRAAYIPGFFKGMFMKAPLMVSFLIVSGFMAGSMTKKACLISGLVLLGCLVAQAVLQNISDRLQSAAGFKVFADKRMQLGDHFRKLSMGYFQTEISGR